MATAISFIPALTLLLVTVIVIWRDPRRMRGAVLSMLLIVGIVNTILGVVNGWLLGVSEELSVWTLLAQFFIALIAVTVLAVLLIRSGVELVRREGWSLSHSLALALGFAILGYLALAIVFVALNQVQPVVLLILLGLPLFYLAFLLVAYLLYSYAYSAVARRWWVPRARTVVVLGAGLQGDRVTPLLRARLDLGIASLRRIGPQATMIVSGGQGPDEAVSEAQAMAAYAREQGVDSLLLEDQSTSTAENLRFSAALASPQPWLVVSSDYHAMRAAMLMSEQGIEGNAIGARTPRYFWSSAVLREYVAILREHPRVNAVILVLLSLPILFLMVSMIVG